MYVEGVIILVILLVLALLVIAILVYRWRNVEPPKYLRVFEDRMTNYGVLKHHVYGKNLDRNMMSNIDGEIYSQAKNPYVQVGLTALLCGTPLTFFNGIELSSLYKL